MQPLKIHAKCVLDAEGRLDQIKSAVERGLPEFGPSPVHEKEICIVGSGPSVRTQLKKIRKFASSGMMILAVKGAHDWLLENKIKPHAALAVDPQPHIVNCFRKKLPGSVEKRPTYLIASQCHPDVFDYLSDQSVVLWHLLASSSNEFLKDRLQIGGGSTSGSRGIVLSWMMGFRTFHLFGFDSCLAGNDKVKLRKITGDQYGDEAHHNVLQLFCEGKTFYADPAMASQANEMQNVVKMLEGSRFKAYGEGLLQTVFKANAEKGLGGYYAVSDQFGDSRVPAIRPEDVANADRDLSASRDGLYRGRNYFPVGEREAA